MKNIRNKGKPVIFISHIVEEKEVAIAFKELIENGFLRMVEVFVSSDEESIQMGQKWLDKITNALKTCTVKVIICSSKSVYKPWINFEAGAGWIKDIPIIPICHSGMEPSKLPVPINLLQAGVATEVSSLKLTFSVIAKVLGAEEPRVDFSEFINKIREFEKVYTFWDGVNKAFEEIRSINPQIIEALKSRKNTPIQLTEHQINMFENIFRRLEGKNILRFKKIGGVTITGTGMYINCIIEILLDFEKVVSDEHFIFYKDFKR
ncbi:MAG: toll/interleukin-1 receptor domain-containing protein [Halobacteriota archaeon]|nr:toll/interleukin-1 receptor domain-containing protein [Halobacteriota archaeon]